MLSRSYAQALYTAAQRTPDKAEMLAQRLIELLQSRNQMHLLASIISDYEAILTRAHERVTPRLTVANEDDAQTYTEAISKALRILGNETKPEISIVPSLIGGFIVQASGQQIDKSYKRSLLDLYTNLLRA